jgi:hypothetical protein
VVELVSHNGNKTGYVDCIGECVTGKGRGIKSSPPR